MEGTDRAQLVLMALEDDDETSRSWLWNVAVQLATEMRGILAPWDQGTPWRRSIAVDAGLRSALATIAQSIERHDAAPTPPAPRPGHVDLRPGHVDKRIHLQLSRAMVC